MQYLHSSLHQSPLRQETGHNGVSFLSARMTCPQVAARARVYTGELFASTMSLEQSQQHGRGFFWEIGQAGQKVPHHLHGYCLMPQMLHMILGQRVMRLEFEEGPIVWSSANVFLDPFDVAGVHKDRHGLHDGVRSTMGEVVFLIGRQK